MSRIVPVQGREERDHVGDLLGPVHIESRAERDDEQEGEQHLRARQRDAQLVEELDQLVVALLAQGSLVHARTVPRVRKD